MSEQEKKHNKRLSKKALIAAIAGTGGAKTLIAEKLGVSRQAVFKWFAKYPDELHDAVQKERERIVEVALGHPQKARGRRTRKI